MRNRRWAIAGLTVVASLALASTACGGSKNSGDASSTGTPVGPKRALADSVAGIAEGNFTFTLTNEESVVTGALHASSKSGQFELKPMPGAKGMTTGFIVIGTQRWVKMDLGPELNESLNLPDKWMYLDSEKITNADALKKLSIDFSSPEMVDPVGAFKIIGSVVSVARTAQGTYTGTVDLTRVKDTTAIGEGLVTSLGDKAKSIPFTAALDNHGRLTQLNLDIPAAGKVTEHEIEMRYADYGSTIAVKRPAPGDTADAPASAYSMLNNE